VVASQVASTPVVTGPGYDIDEIVTTSMSLGGAGSTEGPLRGAESWRPWIRLSWKGTTRRQESSTAEGRAE
jgi:hypothetical protein